MLMAEAVLPSRPRLPLSEHLSELRRRLIISLVVFLVFASISYFYRDTLQRIVLLPLAKTVYYTSPTGGFQFVLTLCIIAGLLASIPIVTFQLLRFIEPALPKKEIPNFGLVVLVSYSLLLLGVAFAYFLSLPAALTFLSEFSSGQVQALITTNEYLSFTATYLLAFGAIFQLPLIFLLINRFHRLSIKPLLKAQTYVIIGSFTLSAILTPTPDPVNQTIMAVPMILLYEISLLIVWWANRRRDRSVVS